MQFFDYFIEHNRYLNIFGIITILVIAALFSRKRSAINIRFVIRALGFHFLVACAVLKTSLGITVLQKIADYVGRLYQFADEGAAFMFGNLLNAESPWGFVFAIKVLPVIVFFGAFTALLFHLHIIQWCVAQLNKLIQPVLGTSGTETLCAIANSFLGQTEAPLLIRNYLKNMTKSQMLVVMVSGMATISGAILAVFVAMGVPAVHLLASSVMAIPASMLIAKILYPETANIKKTQQQAQVTFATNSNNVFDAVAQGTLDGVQLAINIGAMLISFLALLAMLNCGLAAIATYLNSWFGLALPQLSIQLIFSYVLAPFGYLLGFTGNEALAAGQLLGTKVAVNEVIAYGSLVNMGLSERAVNILTYALCGFSNFSCIGIQIGGIGALVPEKRKWLTELGLYAVFGGALSNLLSAMVASLLL